MKPDNLKDKATQSTSILVVLFTGVLSTIFSQQLIAYLNEKMKEFNVWVVDPQVFALIFTGSLLIVLV
jgi:hypothetical protein